MRITIRINPADTKLEPGFFYGVDGKIINVEFVPRVSDTLIINRHYWEVKCVLVDTSNNEIFVFVKDSSHF